MLTESNTFIQTKSIRPCKPHSSSLSEHFTTNLPSQQNLFTKIYAFYNNKSFGSLSSINKKLISKSDTFEDPMNYIV